MFTDVEITLCLKYDPSYSASQREMICKIHRVSNLKDWYYIAIAFMRVSMASINLPVIEIS